MTTFLPRSLFFILTIAALWGVDATGQGLEMTFTVQVSPTMVSPSTSVEISINDIEITIPNSDYVIANPAASGSCSTTDSTGSISFPSFIVNEQAGHPTTYISSGNATADITSTTVVGDSPTNETVTCTVTAYFTNKQTVQSSGTADFTVLACVLGGNLQGGSPTITTDSNNPGYVTGTWNFTNVTVTSAAFPNGSPVSGSVTATGTASTPPYMYATDCQDGNNNGFSENDPTITYINQTLLNGYIVPRYTSVGYRWDGDPCTCGDQNNYEDVTNEEEVDGTPTWNASCGS